MPLRSALAAVLVALIWGVNFVAIDLGLDGMPPTLFVALRFTAVILPAIFFVPRPTARMRDVLAVGVFMSLAQFGLLYTALTLGMPPGLASLVLQAQVVFTVLFAALALREVPTRWQVAGVAIGVAGLVVVGSGSAAHTPVLAFLITLAAAASWAIGNVIARRAGGGPASGPSSGLSMTVWSALVVPVPMLGLSLLIDGPDAVGFALTHLTVPQLLSTAYTAWLASLVGYGIWNTLLARHPTSAVVPFTMLVPPVGIATAWLVLGETPTIAEAIGGVILLAGVAVTTGVFRRRRDRSVDEGEGRVLARAAREDPTVGVGEDRP